MPKRAWPPIPALCGVTPIRRLAGFLQHHTNTPQPSIIAGDESTAAVMPPRRRSIAACFAMPNTHPASRTVFSGLTWSASRHSDHWPASISVVARLISTVALCALHWPQQAGLERARCMANGRLDSPWPSVSTIGCLAKEGMAHERVLAAVRPTGQAAMVVHFHTGASSRGEGFSSYPSDSP